MLNCIMIRSGTGNTLSINKQGIVKSLLKNRGIDSLKLNLQDVLTIYFEQSYLANYLKDSHPDNRDVLNFISQLSTNIIKIKNELTNEDSEVIDHAKLNIRKDTITKVFDYVVTGSASRFTLDTLADEVVGKSKYSILPKDFVLGYNRILQPILKDEIDIPKYGIMLYPSLRNDINEDHEQYVLCSAESMKLNDTYKVKQTVFTSNTLNYLATFDYSTTYFKTVLDMLQRVSLDNCHSLEALSFTTPFGVLKHWFFNDPANGHAQKDNKDILIYFVEYLTKNNHLTLDHSDVEHIVDILQYMSDYRGKFLTNPEPTLEDAKLFNTYKDLNFLLAYGSEAADDTASKDEDAPAEDEGTDDTSDDTGEDTPDDEGSDDTDTDSEDTGDDTGDDEGDDGMDGLDDFGDDDGGESSDTTSESGSGDSDSSDSDTDAAKPEDINPLIQIIDSETFDEHLERKVLSNTLASVLANPPKSLSKDTIDFLQYWLTEWYELCSIDTTKTLLKDVLKVVSPDESVVSPQE